MGIDRVRSLGSPHPVFGQTEYCLDLPAQNLAEIIERHRPQWVIHAAGPASVSNSLARPAADFADNVPPVLNVLEAIRQAKVDTKFILLSSAAVYGNPPQLPIDEDAQLAPLSPYGWHKAISELMVREYASIYGVAAATVRLFSAYGPGLSRQVMWDICTKAQAGGAVWLDGTGEESRDFVHLSDIVAGLHLVGERAPMRGEAYNLASGVETRIAELARGLVEALRVDVDIRFSGAPRPGDPRRWQANLARLALLGYRPGVDLQQGMREYAEWFRAARTGTANG